MPFRMEITYGAGKVKRWEVLCDFCPMIYHYSITQFSTFPNAAKAALEDGWRIGEDGHGRIRYTCPKCEKEKEDG